MCWDWCVCVDIGPCVLCIFIENGIKCVPTLYLINIIVEY